MTRLLAIVLVLLASGCSSLYVDYPTPDPTTLDLSKRTVVTSRGCGFSLLAVIPMRVNSRLDRAWSQLRARAGSKVISDVEQRESWLYLFVGTLWCSHLAANAYPRLEP